MPSTPPPSPYRRPEEWLTRQEAADYARVSTATITRAIQRGVLESARTSSHGLIRIRRLWVDAWLLARR